MTFKFDFKKAEISKAVILERNWLFVLAGPLRKILPFVFVVILAFFGYGFFLGNFSIRFLSVIFGCLVISAVLSLFFWEMEIFFNFKLKNPKLSLGFKAAVKNLDKVNLAEFLNFEAAKPAFRAVNFARRKNFAEINSSVLLYFLIDKNEKMEFIFSRGLLDLLPIRKILHEHLKTFPSGQKARLSFSTDFQETIFDAFKIADKKNHSRVEIGDLLLALAEHDSILKRAMVDADLRPQDIENLVRWTEYIENSAQGRKKFWTYKNLAKHGSLAKQWASAYTLTLDRFSIDWSDLISKNGYAEGIGHENEIEQVERILARTEINNALIVGEPGSGRATMIQALAQKCLFGESLPFLNYKRVVELDVPSLLAQIDDPEKAELVLDKIFKEVNFAGNIILVINEFHNFVGQLVRPGVADISGVLAPYLKSPTFQIVAVTTFEGLHKNIEQSQSLLSLFEKVEVTEISAEDTIVILENRVLPLEAKDKKFVTYPAIRDIVFYSQKYLPDVSFPKKAIDLLDEIMVFVSQNENDKLVLPKHVQKVISEKTQIPVGELGAKEKETLLNLESLLHKRIVGQEEAVSEVSTAMRRARADITIKKGPMGSFLFLGPTGVGKTETSKALAEIYFGAEERMIRIDMSEFQNTSDIARLIGSGHEEGMLTTKVRENPFSLVLLDEFEKAHPDILNLFLQVLDEGYLNDGLGRKVDFKNCLIIATSNAGYKIILEALKENISMPEIKNMLLESLFKEGTFRPELINRFDAVVVFKSLSENDLISIAELLLKGLKSNLLEKGIELNITQPVLKKVAELGYNPIFGAREMRRVIQDKVENSLAISLLSGKVKRGDKIEIDPENFNPLII